MNQMRKLMKGLMVLMMVLFAATAVTADEVVLQEEQAANSEAMFRVVNVREDIDEDFQVIDTESLGADMVAVTAQVTHKKGWFSSSQDFNDRFTAPSDLLDEGYLLVRREIVSIEGKGGIRWEEKSPNGYTCVLHLSKKWMATVEVTCTVKFIMAKGYELPEALYKPVLVSPVSGRIELSEENNVEFRWDGEGDAYRFIIIDKKTGKTVYKRQEFGKGQGIEEDLFKDRRDYAWGVSQADSHLIFSRYNMKEFQSDYKIEQHEVSCQTCNGHGHYWKNVQCTACGGSGHIPDGNGGYRPCSFCRGNGYVNKYVRCDTCHGDGTVIYEFKRRFLIF